MVCDDGINAVIRNETYITAISLYQHTSDIFIFCIFLRYGIYAFAKPLKQSFIDTFIDSRPDAGLFHLFFRILIYTFFCIVQRKLVCVSKILK